jgi:hypothetical protein
MMVTKAHILDEIERTAEANGGRALGRQRFYAETGIKETDRSGKYWVRWSDALREAGYAPNQFQLAYDEQFLLKELAAFVQELGHFPVIAELKLRARQDPEFPSHNTFARFGGKPSWRLVSSNSARSMKDMRMSLLSAFRYLWIVNRKRLAMRQKDLKRSAPCTF